MATTAHVVCLFSSLVSVSVSSDVFGPVGGSVQLNIQNPVTEFGDLTWMFNGTVNVLKYYKKYNGIEPHSSYKDRVEFNEETYSLTLKKLQKTDSGLYEAKASGEENKDVAKYKLSVLEPVDSPHLTYDLSKDTCNITLTCKAHDLSISTNCYNETFEEKTVTSQAFSLSLFINGSFITCNHSNPVNWRESVVEMDEIKQKCASEGNIEELKLPPQWLFLVLILVGLSAVLVIIIWLYRKRSRSTGQAQCENTFYAEVGPSLQNNGAATESEAMLETPSMYCTVGKKPQPPSPVQCDNTVYAMVEHPKTKMDQGMHNTYETIPDNANPVMPETIYSTPSTVNEPVKPNRRKPHQL